MACELVLLIPDWFPGTGWKHQGKEWAKMVRNMYLRPYEKVRKDEVSPRVTLLHLKQYDI